jgi:hypothetical protein
MLDSSNQEYGLLVTYGPSRIGHARPISWNEVDRSHLEPESMGKIGAGSLYRTYMYICGLNSDDCSALESCHFPAAGCVSKRFRISFSSPVEAMEIEQLVKYYLIQMYMYKLMQHFSQIGSRWQLSKC